MNANVKNKKYTVETPMEELSEETLVEETVETVETAETTNTEEVDRSYEVEVSTPHLNIRKGPGKNYNATGNFTGVGIFKITDVETGEGSNSGWGKLESGEGWISLDYAKRV